MSSDKLKTILVTGGCGFIASNVIQRLLSSGKYFVINVDKMNYCANSKNVSEKYNFEHWKKRFGLHYYSVLNIVRSKYK